MSEYTPIANFPNFIYLPKIVPLVYDDALSYYEFLNKVLGKLNEAIDGINDLGVDVSELRENVERLATLVDGFDGRIESLETSVSSINTAIETINTTLTNYGTQLETLAQNDTALANRITVLENKVNTDIAAAVTALETQISGVASDVTAMESQVSSNTDRIEALETATLEAPVLANENLFTINEFQDLDNLDYEIVEVTDNGSTTDNIQVSSGLITMYPNAAYNEMALVLHNVLPILVGTYTSSMILSFGLKYKTSGSNNGTDYCVNVPITSLTGSSPYIANTDYTETRASLRVLQLKPSTDGKHYDLWIYNRYHGQYGILTGANVSILAFGMVFRGFTSAEGTTVRKAFFSTCYGSKGAQVNALIQKKIPGIVSACNNTASMYATTAQESAEANARNYTNDMYDITVDEVNSYIDDSSVAHDDLSGVSINAIQNLNSDVTVDYSNTKYGISHFTGTSFAYDTWSEEIRLFINVEVTITGSGAVNTNDSIPVVNISNTLGAVIPSLIPLTVHAALPAKAPFVEAYLHTNGNVIFRCWFDDTNYNYTDNPIKVRIAGFVPLSYTASAPD